MPQLAHVFGKVYQGSFPEPLDVRGFDVIINVSDCDHGSVNITEKPHNSKHPDRVRKHLQQAIRLWFPINETGKWDYAAFFGVKRALDYYSNQDDVNSILVHCSAGVDRSVLVVCGWLISNGETSNQWFHAHQRHWERFLKQSRAPKSIVKFLHTMNEHRSYGIGGILSKAGLYDQLYVRRRVLDKMRRWCYRWLWKLRSNDSSAMNQPF